MNERRFDVDNFKGILILLVVFGHLMLPTAYLGRGLCYSAFSFIYFFHMPLFLFIAGFVTEELKKESILKYIFLYFLFNFTYAIVDNWLNGTEISFIRPYYSMWFLICIIIYRLLVHFCKNLFLFFPFSIILSICSGFSSIDNTFALSRIFTFLPFFLLGYILSQNNFLKIKNDSSKKIRIEALFVFVILIISALFCSTNFKKPVSFYTVEQYVGNKDAIYRTIILFLDSFLSIIFLFVIPNKKIPFITQIGKNSLNIYLFHRFITLLLEKIFIIDKFRFIVSFLFTIIICILFGSEIFNKTFNKFVKKLIKNQIYVYFFLILFLFTYYLENAYENYENSNKLNINFDNCVKISYIGDLILLEDEIYNAKLGDSFDFSDYFKYTKDLFGDYTFGVLEGPISNSSYSTGNFSDNKKMALNYPIEFLEEISNNIDFVTIGTNHILDKGKKGLEETINNLNKVGLDYTGAFLEGDERINIIDVEGIKFAVLSYTYGVNHNDELEDYMINEFDEESIIRDINRAKGLNVDKIIVMGHIGTQFMHETNYEQDYFNNLFATYGIDIVLLDHAHATQPIEFIGDTLIFNCPGNYVNSFTEYDGGYSAICNIYIDKDSKEIVTSSIVPLVARKDIDKLTVPITCYSIDDIEGSNIVTKSMIGKKFPYVQEELFFNKNGYVTVPPKETIDTNNEIFDFIGDDSICFVGDSITEGTANGGYAWYESIDIPNTVYNISKGGATTTSIKNILENNERKSEFDCYIIAIGTNDIRYYNPSPKEYISNLEEIIKVIGIDKKYIFVNPWYFLDSDYISIIDIENKDEVFNEFDKALEEFCNNNGYLHVNPNNYLKDFFESNKPSLYLTDFIHPNIKGIEIYSKAFIEGENNLDYIKN